MNVASAVATAFVEVCKSTVGPGVDRAIAAFLCCGVVIGFPLAAMSADTLWTNGSCAQEGPGDLQSHWEAPEGLTLLCTEELKILFRDIELHDVLPGRPMFPSHEEFRSDGTYVRNLDLSDDEGTFTIRNGQVCVTGDYPRCRFVYRGPKGHLFLLNPDLPRKYLKEFSVRRP